METFSPGDRVVAIHPDLPGPICGPADPARHPFRFPDGPLRRDVIYHVAAVSRSRDGNQGLSLTGMRVFWGPREIPWNSTRFRKVDSLQGHLPQKRRRRQPVGPPGPGGRDSLPQAGPSSFQCSTFSFDVRRSIPPLQLQRFSL